jgi:dihydroorotase
MSTNPARIINIDAGTLQTGKNADIVLFDPDESYVVDVEKLHGKSKNTPFKNLTLQGMVKYTILDGRIVFER